MYYQLHELTHAALSPWRAAADVAKLYFKNPLNPVSHTPLGRSVAAGCEVFERTTRRYGKPTFGLDRTSIDGKPVSVHEKAVWSRPFCNLIHFERAGVAGRGSDDPKLLIVAPMSGHYATLLRGTVEAMLPDHEVYITDWVDARMVPLADGPFDLDDYIDYVIDMLRFLGEDTHVMAVCQPSVPVLAAVAVMEAGNDPLAPASMTLMGGPIDTRINPTEVNKLAETKSLDWFERNVIMTVPYPQPGFMRRVYPGFLQLSGFMSMNLDRHMIAHREFFMHLVQGDGDSAEKHRDFYDEYLAVMDLTAEFYLQTVDVVFINHALPKGEFMHRDMRVDPSRIRNCALLTVEGENDDISGLGQTEAAQHLCTGLPAEKRMHYVQPNVGHYGVFNGSRFRLEIAPRITAFIRAQRAGKDAGRAAAAPNGSRAPVAATAVRPAATPKTADRDEGQGRPAKGLALKTRKSRSLKAIMLTGPEGARDDLKQISGIGPKLERSLNELGIFHYWQLAALTDPQLSALDDKLAFKGRARREDWVGQARRLAEG